MEAIGGIASVIGVVGFIGQIAGGCKVVKEIIGDIKNAPKDIIRLAECIKSIEESSNEVLRQHEQLKTHYGMQDIPAAGAHMLEAIKAIENKLSSSAEIFGNSTTGSKNKRKQFWHRLKYAANKEEIKKLIEWVDSTTQQVTLVQQNLSRIIQLEQSDFLGEISSNIIAVPHAIHDSRDAIISAQKNQTETLRSEMQKSQSHLVQIMSTTIATKALEDVREDLLLSLKGAMEECIEAQRLDIGPQVQFLVGKCLQRNLPIHSAKIAEKRGNDVSVSLSSSTPCHVTPISHNASSTPDKTQRRKKRKSLISSASYRYKFFGIGVSVTVSSHFNNQNQLSVSSLGSRDLSSTSVSIFLTAPWARRGFDLRYEMPNVPYSRESCISLRPFYIHAKGSEFHKAAKEFDIETARNLFEQGKASPLDEIEGLRDLTNLRYLPKISDNHIPHLEWVKFILRYQINRDIHFQELKSLLFSIIFRGKETLNEVLPLVLECSQDDSLQNPDIMFSLLHMDRPSPEHSQPLMCLKNFEPLIDWNCHEFSSYPGLYLENSRQLFENPQGDGLDAALDRGSRYNLLSDQQAGPVFIGGYASSPPGVSILEFMNLYTGSRSREEVIYCCSNRFETLIKKGHKLNEGGGFSYMAASARTKVSSVECHTVVNYAFQIGAWNHLLEILLQIGWNEREIQDLYDEETLLGVSTLMEGLQYHTIETARQEFLQRLLDGDGYSCFDVERLSWELIARRGYISSAIMHPRLQNSERIDIPGSWPEGQVAIKPISREDLIMPWCLSFYSLTETRSRYHTCIHYGQYHTRCHVPQKEWDPHYADMQLVDMVDDTESDENSD